MPLDISICASCGNPMYQHNLRRRISADEGHEWTECPAPTAAKIAEVVRAVVREEIKVIQEVRE